MSDILDLGGGDSLLLDDSGDELLLDLGLADLLADKGANIELIVRGEYLDDTNTAHIEWASQSGWDDQVSGPAAAYIPPLLTTGLLIDHQIEPLAPLSSFDTISEIELSNNHLDYAGRYDSWWRYSVDNLSWTIYAVGILSNGRRVDLANVIDTPLFELQGIHIPEIGSDTCKINCRDIHNLDTALQPVTYSPPALYFPGSPTEYISIGNNINITGVQSISVWVYLHDPASTMQYILFKDSGTAGYYLAVGLVGSGTIVGGVEILVRGQSPTTTTTAANVLRAFQWHRIDISIDTTTRRIDIDGTTAITTSSITGTPTTTTTALTIGKSFLGRMSRVLYWSNARSNAVMAAEGRTPITGAESNLREAFLFHEGEGSTTASIKAGSAIVGAIGTGILWDNASWHYASLLGQYEPYVLGTVPRVPVTWIDPPKQIGQVSRGAVALLSELQSNHSAVSSANYTVNNSNGTVTVTSGALSGTYSATVTANNLWNSALLFNGTTSKALATLTMPAASKYIAAQIRIDNTTATNRQIAGWNAGTSAFILRMDAGSGTNRAAIVAVNDGGTVFVAASAMLVQGRRYSVVGSLDTANPSTGLKLYIDGVLVATTVISGAWTGTQTTLAIGHRNTSNDLFFTGVIDELVIGNSACTLAMAKLHHSTPSTSAMTGALAGWHLDDATGSSAVPFVGAVSLALTSTTWTAGRSAITDLARSILFTRGYTESDLDTDLWLAALNKNPADCGWFVSAGMKTIDVINAVLGGLGFIIISQPGSTLKIKRFEGLTGVAEIEIDPEIELQSAPIEAMACDPPIYQWTVNFATNNSKQDIANIAGGLATTDPDRYQYGAVAYRSVPRSDGSILSRFPNAEPRSRTTALLNLVDAEAEAARLIEVHRYGADRKQLATFVANEIEILTEIGPLMAETELDAGTMLLTGVSMDGERGTLTIWRPSI